MDLLGSEFMVLKGPKYPNTGYLGFYIGSVILVLGRYLLFRYLEMVSPAPSEVWGDLGLRRDSLGRSWRFRQRTFGIGAV